MDDREKLVELLIESKELCTKKACGYCDYFRAPYCKSHLQADYLLSKGVTVQRWIPVTERLPKQRTGQVLVVKQFNGEPYVDIGEVLDGRAYCYSDDYCIRPSEHILTHWMPLPEPPKEE